MFLGFWKKEEPKTFDVDEVWFDTALDGLFCKMGNIRIIFVGTGVLDGPSKHSTRWVYLEYHKRTGNAADDENGRCQWLKQNLYLPYNNAYLINQLL